MKKIIVLIICNLFVLNINAQSFVGAWEINHSSENGEKLEGMLVKVFNVTVEGIDEFTTREDWNRIWRDRVRSQQALFWEQRGQRPQGRKGPDLERLKQALPYV